MCLGIVYQRAPVSECAPSELVALRRAERLARRGIRALRARQENQREDRAEGAGSIAEEGVRLWGMPLHSPRTARPCPLHSWLARSLPAHPRHCKVAAFRCSPLRSLFRGDGMGW